MSGFLSELREELLDGLVVVAHGVQVAGEVTAVDRA